KVEREGAAPAANVEGRERPLRQVRGQDGPGILPGARPVVVAGEALQGAAFVKQGAKPAWLLRQVDLQHVAVDRGEGAAATVPHVEQPGWHARVNPVRRTRT